MDAHECLGLPQRGQVPQTYPIVDFVTTASAYRGDTGHPLGCIRGLGQFKRIEVVAGSRPWMLVRVEPQHSAVDDMS